MWCVQRSVGLAICMYCLEAKVCHPIHEGWLCLKNMLHCRYLPPAHPLTLLLVRWASFNVALAHWSAAADLTTRYVIATAFIFYNHYIAFVYGHLLLYAVLLTYLHTQLHKLRR